MSLATTARAAALQSCRLPSVRFGVAMPCHGCFERELARREDVLRAMGEPGQMRCAGEAA